MHKIKVRWVIVNNEKIFLVREIKKHFYYLPWGTLEGWESFKDCLKRELMEELWVKAIIWDIVNIREFKTEDWFYLDLWFKIENSKDFLNIEKENTSHWFEYYDEGFYSYKELEWCDVRPKNLEDILKNNINISFI